jgi:hypothetical protein
VKEQVAGESFDVKILVRKQEFHSSRMNYIVSELFILTFDKELAAKFGGFEVDVVEADGGGDFVEESFGADEESVEVHVSSNDEGSKVVGM